MATSEGIRAALTAAFRPTLLEVVDESDQHKGHAGARPGGGTHFRVTIAARAFNGMSRIERHRAVNEALRAEFAGGLHALSIEASGEPG